MFMGQLGKFQAIKSLFFNLKPLKLNYLCITSPSSLAVTINLYFISSEAEIVASDSFQLGQDIEKFYELHQQLSMDDLARRKAIHTKVCLVRYELFQVIFSRFFFNLMSNYSKSIIFSS